ncbi:MAG: alpha-L-fucosidase [Halobacteriaceae archaeon]
MANVPAFLDGYEAEYERDPRAATLSWFEDAKYGLFLHYGLYSLLGDGEWVQYHDRIPPAEYAQLRDYFTAEGFDAEAVVELAADAGMEYVNLTTRHHDSFCLFDSAETGFTSVEAPCGRDLVAELADACREEGLGLFCYYSHGRDWRHPHAPNNDAWAEGSARPEYDQRPKLYAGEGHDLQRYLDFVSAQVEELCTEYGPLAGVWFDGWSLPNVDPDAFDLPDLYTTVRDRQPQALVSYKNGLTGTEDFLAPERGWLPLESDPGKPVEVCAPMNGAWGYDGTDGRTSAEEVWDLLGEVRGEGANLLLNTAPLPDGSIGPRDAATLREVGDRLRAEGFPQRS